MVLWILLKDGTLIIEVSAFLKWIFNFLQTNDEGEDFYSKSANPLRENPLKIQLHKIELTHRITFIF